MAEGELITSAVRRFVRLGGLAGRVGASVLSERLLELARAEPGRQARQTENLVRNAVRIVSTLGELKGAAMKVGQMLSLHEGLLPPEVAEVLRSLQRQAPRVPAEVMEYEIRGALDDYDRLFEELDFEAFAAASIGQVHLGRLRDGRRVAVKIQYPLIEEIVKADLKNLKNLLRSLFNLVMDMDFEPFWRELRDRLLEELDYTHEAASMGRMAELHRDVPEIVIPSVVPEATARTVLTMEYVAGITPERACSDEFEDELRSHWGVVLLAFQLRGLLEHRLLHADPNLSNFAFLDDGRVIVYDFGCVKEVPESIANGYARLIGAVLDGRRADIPGVLVDMGVMRDDGSPLPLDLLGPYLDLFEPMLATDPPYTFGGDDEFYRRVLELGLLSWSESRGLRAPEDLVFIDRSLAGHFGNLCRLRPTAAWRDLLLDFSSRALPPAGR